MKAFAAAVTCFALLSSLVRGESCSAATLASVFANSQASACWSDSGLSVSSALGSLTQRQLTKLCGSDACVAMLKSALAADVPDCTVPVGSGFQLRSQVIEPAATVCGVGIGSAGSASNSARSASKSDTVGSAGSSSSSGGSTSAGASAGSDKNGKSATPPPVTDRATSVSVALGASFVTVAASAMTLI